MIYNALKDSLPPNTAVPDTEIDAVTTVIIGMMDGLQVQWLLDPTQVDMPAAVELVIESVLARWGVQFRDQADTRGSAVGR